VRWLDTDTGWTLFGAVDDLWLGGDGLHDTLRFDTRLVPYDGDRYWVMEAFRAAVTRVLSWQVPDPGPECAWCKFAARFVDRGARSQAGICRVRPKSARSFRPPDVSSLSKDESLHFSLLAASRAVCRPRHPSATFLAMRRVAGEAPAMLYLYVSLPSATSRSFR
jgi:hypothetical protein